MVAVSQIFDERNHRQLVWNLVVLLRRNALEFLSVLQSSLPQIALGISLIGGGLPGSKVVEAAVLNYIGNNIGRVIEKKPADFYEIILGS